MNLYLIAQDIVDWYDSYDSAVVAARSPKDAKTIHPSGRDDGYNEEYYYGDWVTIEDIDQINVTFLGKTKHKRGVILASFNAG